MSNPLTYTVSPCPHCNSPNTTLKTEAVLGRWGKYRYAVLCTNCHVYLFETDSIDLMDNWYKTHMSTILVSTVKPLPCPWCKSPDVTMDNLGHGHTVRCRRCGAHGPVSHDPSDTICLWNIRDEDYQPVEVLSDMLDPQLVKDIFDEMNCSLYKALHSWLQRKGLEICIKTKEKEHV